jgi:hypothetical protein
MNDEPAPGNPPKYLTHPLTPTLQKAKDDALDRKPHGSGTLVKAGEKFGILTASHVANDLWESEKQICIVYSFKEHLHELDRAALNPIHIAPIQPNGPDLCFLHILDHGLKNNLAALKSFYPIGRASFSQFDPFPLNRLNWFLFGAPAEMSENIRREKPGRNVFHATHFLGLAYFESQSFRDGLDYLELTLHADALNYPQNYGGVSGGGIWIVLPSINTEIGESSITYRAPFLAGVPFFQGDLIENKRRILGHGPESLLALLEHVSAQSGTVSGSA